VSESLINLPERKKKEKYARLGSGLRLRVIKNQKRSYEKQKEGNKKLTKDIIGSQRPPIGSEKQSEQGNQGARDAERSYYQREKRRTKKKGVGCRGSQKKTTKKTRDGVPKNKWTRKRRLVV